MPPTIDVEAILREREARGLRVPAAVRVGVLGYLALSLIFMAPDRHAVVGGLPIAGGLVVANVIFLWQLARRRHVRAIGYAGAVLDAMTIGAIVLVWYWVIGRGELPPGFLAKAPVTIFTLTLIAINSLALRAVYPLIVTAGGLVVHLAIAVAVIRDERTVWATSFVEVFSTDAVAQLLLVNEVVIVAVVGVGLAYLSRTVQRTIRQAVELESERSRMQQEHTRVLLEQKLEALAKLVAGISHEVNSPLGALRSGVDTQLRAAERVEAAARSRDSEALERPLSAIRDSVSATAEAAERIDATMRSLRRFARLDEGKRQRVDLHECLDSAIAMLPEEARTTRLSRDYGRLPAVDCDPGQLNQAFLSLLAHACTRGSEAVEVRTRVVEAAACVEITYRATGEEGQEVFDVGIASRHSRVAAGFDLPIAHSIVSHHGGSLELERVEQQSRFVVRFQAADA